MTYKTTPLGSIATITSGGTPDRKSATYWNGDIPWVKTAQIQNKVITAADIDEWITAEGLSDSSTRMIPRGTILMAMYGQGKTRGQVAILDIDAAINQACAAILLKGRVDRDYVFQQLLYRYNSIRALSNTGSQENLNADLIREITFPLPSFDKQVRISRLLAVWDTAIEKTERLIAAKEQAHRWLQQQLIDHKVARQHWGTLALGDVIQERSERSTVHDEYPVLTSSRRGLFLQAEYFSKQVTSEDNTGYKIMRRGDFTFRSMSDDGRFVFNRLTEHEAGIISPAYGVFFADGVNPAFLSHYLNSRYFGQLLARETQGGTRKALRFSALAAMEVDLPSQADQERIAAILDESRREIDLLRMQLDRLRHQKRGLMQKLLTGEWRVPVPEEATA